MSEYQLKPRMSRKARWITAAVVVVFVTPFLAHGVWTLIAANRVARQVEAIQAAGEPILPADFAPANVDGADNAAPDLISAAEAIDKSDPLVKEFTDLEAALPLTPDERRVISAMLSEFAGSLDGVDAAAAKPRVAWPLDTTQPVIMNSYRWLGAYRHLARLHADAVLLEHEAGDDASALRRLDRLLFLNRAVGAHPTIISHLVGVRISVLAADRAAQVAPDLRIGTETGRASPEQMHDLIDQLLDDASARTSYAMAMRGERMMQLDTIRAITGGKPITLFSGSAPEPWNPLKRYMARPVAYHGASVMMDYMSAAIPAVGQPNWPAARSALPARPSDSPLNIFARIFMPAFGRVAESTFRATTDRRLAAVALAVGWYAAEHDGQRPARLDDLVPRYLPEVPIDPMSPNGTPLQYLPRADDPIVYSVGLDGVDDGGSEVVAKPGDPNPNEWSRKDRVVPLTRRPRPEPEQKSDGVGDLPAERLAPATQPEPAE